MYKLNNEKEQGNVIHEVITKEYHFTTEGGIEFSVHVEDYWHGVTFYTNLSEDESHLAPFREISYKDKPLYDFLLNTDFYEIEETEK
jgi:hypothetical protein